VDEKNLELVKGPNFASKVYGKTIFLRDHGRIYRRSLGDFSVEPKVASNNTKLPTRHQSITR